MWWNFEVGEDQVVNHDAKGLQEQRHGVIPSFNGCLRLSLQTLVVTFILHQKKSLQKSNFWAFNYKYD